jgi:type IV pilus assembly protein PilE
MKKRFTLERKLPAFTLTELLVVLVIIGILILLALPSLMPLISKTRGIEAKQALKHVHSLEKTFFYEHSKYTNSLEEIGFEQEALASEDGSGKANYKVEILEAAGTTFLARATAVRDFDGDGQFNIWEIDQDQNLREVTKD